MVGLLSPVLAFGAAFWTMEALNQREMRRQREFVKETFSRYVAPKVVDTLIGRPDLVPAEGERRTMTFLFTDIADFTTMAEGTETGVLTRVLNAYLDGMTVIVHKHGGIVDKFIGDAVFAIFNAPLDQPDHAGCAVQCGLEMDRFSQAFRVEQQKQDLNIGITRIGINTGIAVVGNFGSKARFDYTAQGDAVNTAARLEGLNKYLGTRICVSETTQALCDSLKFRPIASVVLKGKTTPVGIWEPLDGDDRRAALLERYNEAYARLDGDDMSAAMALFSALSREAPDDPCISLHLKRLKEGVYGTTIVMTEK